MAVDRGRLLSFNRAIVGSLSAAAGALTRSFDMGDAGLEIIMYVKIFGM